MLLIPEFSTVVFGLASAISWGVGDFTGGLVTKRVNVFIVAIVSQIVGALLVLGMAFLLREPFPHPVDLAFGAAAGIAGAIGLVTFYRGLALGRMGVVAPVAAVVAAGLPVAFGALIEGLPAIHQMLGFLLAFFAVWMISSKGGGERIRLSDLGPPFVAGLGFGSFYILIDRVSMGNVYWPLVTARFASLLFLILLALIMRQGGSPRKDQLPVIAFIGVLDTGGIVFYTLATQAGRLDIAAVLASLYPAMTVLLARSILKEQLSYQQWIGLITTLLAVVLITI